MTQMNPQTPDSDGSNNTVLIIIAIALGVIVAVLTNVHISNIRKQVEQDMATVYRLDRSLKAGEKLKLDDVTAVKYPKEMVRQNKLMTTKDIESRKNDPVLRPVNMGEYLTWDVFTSSGQGTDIDIASGMRACPIEIASQGRPGALEPGMLVDVYAPVTVPGQPPKSMLVLEKVRVLMVGDRTLSSTASKTRSSSYSNVTVELPPKVVAQVFSIQQWMGRAEFFLTIRRPADSDVEIIDGGVNPALLELIRKSPVSDGRSGR